MKRIAIVGSGMAGLGTVWLLQKQSHAITAFEAARPGGHTHTVDMTLNGVTRPVDTGFLVFNDRTYPYPLELFAELGVRSLASEMSFSVGSAFAYSAFCLRVPLSVLESLPDVTRELARGLLWRYGWFTAGLKHRLNANSRRRARRNIVSHYDLGNAFHRLWLDDTMTYSPVLSKAMRRARSARTLTAAEARVALSARDTFKLEEVARGSPSATSVLIAPLDFTDGEAVAAALDRIRTAWGDVDLILVVAGTHQWIRTWELTDANARALLETNLHGPERVVAGVPALLQHGYRAIGIVSSLAGYRGLPKALVYGVSPAALIDAQSAAARVRTFYEWMPADLDHLAEIYAPNGSFRDPFHEARGVPAIGTIFERMFEQLGDRRFRILEALADQRGVLLIWEMTFRCRRFLPGHRADHPRRVASEVRRRRTHRLLPRLLVCGRRALREAAAHRSVHALFEETDGVRRGGSARVGPPCMHVTLGRRVLTQLSDSAII